MLMGRDGAPDHRLPRETHLRRKTTAFETKFGYPPMRIALCMDANIVFVNKANPITSISMEQLDAIYSKRRLGKPGPAEVWGDLGVRGELAKRTINAYSRAEGTGTRASFANMALLGGRVPGRDHRPGGFLDALAEAISTDVAGIAYGPMASWFATNKTLPAALVTAPKGDSPPGDGDLQPDTPCPRLFFAYLNRAPG